MANNNPSPATRFRVGNTAAKNRDPVVASVKKMGARELAETCELILHASRAELAAILADPNTPMLQVSLISAIMADSQKGLTYTLDKLLERTVGKPKERIELSGDPDNPMTLQAVQVMISLPSNGRETVEAVNFKEREKLEE